MGVSLNRLVPTVGLAASKGVFSAAVTVDTSLPAGQHTNSRHKFTVWGLFESGGETANPSESSPDSSIANAGTAIWVKPSAHPAKVPKWIKALKRNTSETKTT